MANQKKHDMFDCMENNHVLKKKYNAKRLKKIIFLKLKNNRLAYDIQNYLQKNKMTKYRQYLDSLYRHVVGCSSFVLMKDFGNNEYEYITTHTCKDKLCFICNAERRRQTRNRYNAWFDRNPYLYKSEGKTYTSATRPIGCEDRVPYDLMHLTLTVPHSDKGYKGKKLYFNEIISDFNKMRKFEMWQYWVYGGEYGVEATPGAERGRTGSEDHYYQRSVESGLHIHIHALLMVRRAPQNRNRLHREILLIWNRITTDYANARDNFDSRVVYAIKKGNSCLTDADIMQLSPNGATFIHLKNIYVKDDNGKIQYAADSREARIRAVLETVSYHFKPKTFERVDGSFDVRAIAEVYAATKGLIMYRKFGCLHKDKTLNLKDTSLLDELSDAKAAEESAAGVAVDTAGVGYFLSPPLNLYVEGDNIRIKAAMNTMDVESNTTKGALAAMAGYIKKNKLF